MLRDVLGQASLSDVTEEISNLADAILDLTYHRIREELTARHGVPRLADGSPCGFTVISLGKLGGQELNYSSDIDLMFIYAANGETDGAEPDHQQGILQEGCQPLYRASLQLTRPKASATASISGCGPTGVSAKYSSRSTAPDPITSIAAAIGNCRC